jgi:ribosome-binding protein aMBF1 (putative translation factor)
VSRSWLYQQPELRAQIDQLPGRPTSGNPAAVPTAEQATADSLRQLVHTYRAEINRLRAENQTLREQLARRLGAERTAAITGRS